MIIYVSPSKECSVRVLNNQFIVYPPNSLSGMSYQLLSSEEITKVSWSDEETYVFIDITRNGVTSTFMLNIATGEATHLPLEVSCKKSL